MSRAQPQRSLHKRDKSQAPLALISQDDSSESFNGYESAESKEKDATELELEKLVFGDELGFYDGIKSLNDAAIPGTESEAGIQVEDDENELIGEGLEGVDDADVRT